MNSESAADFTNRIKPLVKLYKQSDELNATQEAVHFYVGQEMVAKHCTAGVPHNEKGEVALEFEAHIMRKQLVTMVAYCFYIILRECRHANGAICAGVDFTPYHPDAVKLLKKIYNGKAKGDLWTLCGVSDFGKATIVDVAWVCEAIYFQGSWSGSFGGPKWGEIAKNFRRFAEGAIPPTVFLDTCYTIAHNTGPIFNKGVFYQNGMHLLQVLDLQHAGTLSDAVQSNTYHQYLSDKLILSFGLKKTGKPWKGKGGKKGPISKNIPILSPKPKESGKVGKIDLGMSQIEFKVKQRIKYKGEEEYIDG